MLFFELYKIRQAGEGAVFVENFANDYAGVESRELRKIDCGLGVSGALQDPACLGAQWEDVPRLHQLIRMCIGITQDADRFCAVVRTDPGGDSLRGIDRDREVGLMGLAIF